MGMTVDSVVNGSEAVLWDEEEVDSRQGIVGKGELQAIEAIFTFGPEGRQLTTREIVLIKKEEVEENQRFRKIDKLFGKDGSGKYEFEIEVSHKFGGGESKTDFSAKGSCSDSSGNSAYVRGHIDSEGKGEIAGGAHREGYISPDQHRIDRGE